MRKKKLFIVLVLPVLLVISLYSRNYLLAEDVGQSQDATVVDPIFDRFTLDAAGRAMLRGDFELARPYIDRLNSSDPNLPYAKSLFGLLGGYDQLMDELLRVRREAYKEYLEKVDKKIGRTGWRNSLLQASLASEFGSDDKTEFEQRQREKINENWLAALTQLVASHNLAERMEIPEEVVPALREEIINRTLQIAQEMEKQDKSLEAYSKVYGLLSMLDQQKYQYDDLHDRLQRQVVLQAVYAPDPNTEGVNWRERRDGITFEMVQSALAYLYYQYVSKPDFAEMAHKALENSLLLCQTDELKQTFEQLNDAEAVKTFSESIKLLVEKVDEIDREVFGFSHLLLVLKNLEAINQDTLKFPAEVILAEFTEGAVSALDVNTQIVWPGDLADFRKNLTNEFSGVGITIVKDKEGILQVDSLVSYDAPAYKAGLEAGDLVLSVDGRETKSITLQKAVHLITGPTGTDVILTVEREGLDQPRDFTVTRKNIIVPTVKGLCRDRDGAWQYLLDPNDGIAYVRLTHFSGESPSRLKSTLRRLKKQGMRALVMDLRGNAGGFLSGAVEIADAFITSGDIVSSRYRMPEQQDVKKAVDDGFFTESVPLVVLINSVSASASEIVAGALKDHSRAVIVGTRSYGKGSVQTVMDLPGSTAQMKLTVAYYYLPNGRRVHRDPVDRSNKDYGVEPQIRLELTGSQIEKFIKVQHDAGVLHRDDLPVESRTWKVFTVDEVVESDPQLKMALLALRARLWAQSNTPEAAPAATALAPPM